MGLAEDKNKVQRIVAGSAPGLHALYRGHLEQARAARRGPPLLALLALLAYQRAPAPAGAAAPCLTDCCRVGGRLRRGAGLRGTARKHSFRVWLPMVSDGPGRACREWGGGAARQASPRRPPEARTLTAGAVRAQGAEAARARLQRAPGPGGMWSQDTTAESRRQLVELLPLVRHSNPAPRA